MTKKGIKMKKSLLLILIAISLFSCKKSPDPYKYFSSASDLLESGKYEASIKASEKAAELFKDFFAYENGEAFYYDCLTMIGEAHLRNGDAKKAQEQFEMTFDLAPENENVLLGIAAVHFRLQKYSEAKAFFESCLERHKENANIIEAINQYYEAIGGHQ